MTAAEAEAFVRARHPEAAVLQTADFRPGLPSRWAWDVWDGASRYFPRSPTPGDAWKAAAIAIREAESAASRAASS